MSNTHQFVSRASFSSYAVLTAPFLLLVVLFVSAAIRRPELTTEVIGPICIFLAGSLAWCVWLRGFKIAVSNDAICYRNGLWRWHKLALQEAVKVEFLWIHWKVFTRAFEVPRIVITTRNGSNSLLINPKPFPRSLLRKLERIIN